VFAFQRFYQRFQHSLNIPNLYSYNNLFKTPILWYVPNKTLGANGQYKFNNGYGQSPFFIGMEKTQ